MSDDETRTITEINPLSVPDGRCQWDRGCSRPATHNVCQYDATTAHTLQDGVDASFCRAHARAFKARIDERE